MARTITTHFLMKENYTGGMRRAAAATTDFQKKVTAAARALDKENRRRRDIRINARPATGAIAEVRKNLAKLKDVRINVAARVQNFKRDMKPVTQGIQNLVKKPLLVTLKLKDMAMAGLRKAADIVRLLTKGAAIGLSVSGAALGYALGQGATLQEYQANMQQSLTAANPKLTQGQAKAQADVFTQWFSEFASNTTGNFMDVVAAGSYGLQFTGGNWDATKGLMKAAQDMKARLPGSTVYDAIEAIYKASKGSTEELRKYGISMTSDAIKAAGGDPFKAKDSMGRLLLQAIQGSEAGLAATGAGTWDILKGKFQGGIATAGSNILTALQPLLLKMLPYADEIAAKMSDMGTSIGEWITNAIPRLGELWTSVQTIMTPFIAWILDKWAMLQPFRDLVGGALSGVNVDGEAALAGIGGAMDSLVNTLINFLNGLAANWDKIEPVIAGIIKNLPLIAGVFAGLKVLSWSQTTFKALSGLFSGAGGIFRTLFGRNVSTPATPTTPIPPAKDTPPAKDIDDSELEKVGGAKALWEAAKRALGKVWYKVAPVAQAVLPGAPVIADWINTQKTLYEQRDSMAGVYALQAAIERYGIDSPQVAGIKGAQRNGIWFGGRIGSFGEGQEAGITGNTLFDYAKRGLMVQQQMIERQLTLRDILFGAQVPKPVQDILQGNTATGTLQVKIVTDSEGNTFPVNDAGGHYDSDGNWIPKAAGIKRVPWDNYPALLHKGETVLPSGEAGEYRERGNSSGGRSFIIQGGIHVHGANKDGKQIVRDIIRGLEQAALTFNPA